jgi:ABC-type antimicrobial peptide transport system permease subunit
MFGLGIAVLIGLLGALVPAVLASRVKIVDTLRVVD